MSAPRGHHRPIYQIAEEIMRDWTKPYFGAVPYIQAMHAVSSINDRYGADTAENVILYFLANANTWRGEVARRVKAELKAIVRETRR